MVDSYRPDVVILDLMLPKISGLDLLKRLRSRKDMTHLPVIVFSNTYMSNMVQEAWKAGATKCLSKANCTPKQFVEVVSGVLHQPPTTAAKAAPAMASRTGERDAGEQAALRQSFLGSLPGALAVARLSLQSLAKITDTPGRVKQLQELYRRVHGVTGTAGTAGFHAIAQMADALEALIKELYEKPTSINASTLRTVAMGIDFLGVLFDKTAKPGAPPTEASLKANILVVDDEAISRRAVSYALEKGRLPCTTMESPEAALQLLSEKTFDLIFLDVDMPGINGFELCTRLRGTVRNKSTPVVFVTGLSDFESRANSTISGGNDLIAKPFLFIELTVKALVYLLRGKLTAPAK
jgi:DNA-binding response OmpR family regulator